MATAGAAGQLRNGPAPDALTLFTQFGAPRVTVVNLHSMFVAVTGTVVVLALCHTRFGRRVV